MEKKKKLEVIIKQMEIEFITSETEDGNVQFKIQFKRRQEKKKR